MGNQKTDEEIGQDFLDWCQKIGHAKVEVEIMNGVPVRVFRATQSIRFDLTKSGGDTTME